MLDQLPEAVLGLILRKLHSAKALVAARRSCRALAAAIDDHVWEELALMYAWRLQQDAAETCEAYCRRGHRGERRQRIVLLGGCDEYDEPVVDVHAFEPRRRRWDVQPFQLLEPRDAPATACDGTQLLVIGGWSESEDAMLASVARARVESAHSELPILRWDHPPRGAPEPPSLSKARCFAAAVLEGASGRLWLAGGGSSLYQGARCMSEIETLDQSGTVWRTVGQLLRPRCGLALAIDQGDAQIYACGGYGGGFSYEATVETFELGTGQQHMLSPMRTPRSGAGMSFGPDGALYVLAGTCTHCSHQPHPLLSPAVRRPPASSQTPARALSAVCARALLWPR